MSDYYYNDHVPAWPKREPWLERARTRWTLLVLLVLFPLPLAAVLGLIYAIVLPIIVIWTSVYELLRGLL